MTAAQIATLVAQYIAADAAAREELDIQVAAVLEHDTIGSIEVDDDCLVCYGDEACYVLTADGLIAIE